MVSKGTQRNNIILPFTMLIFFPLSFSGNALISQPVINQFGSPTPLRPSPCLYPSIFYWGPLSPTYFGPVQMSPQTFNHYAPDRTLVSF